MRRVLLLLLASCVAANEVPDERADSSMPESNNRTTKTDEGPKPSDPVDEVGSEPSATTIARAPTRTTPTALPVPDGFYPRVIQRANGTIVASVVRFLPSGRMGATVFASTDEGVSFKEIGAVDDAINQGGLCCGTLYELPRALGAMPAGTLLWSASAGGDAPNAPMTLPVWKSTDDGRTWQFVSKIATGSKPRKNGGLWEPEFSMLDDGQLAVHWSDETDGAHSQKLVVARSADGVTWKDQHDTIALATFGLRPGMANVRHPPGAPFTMSYEICGLSGDSCTAFVRTSNDGWTWGDAKNRGTRIATAAGLHFRHAPTLAWSAGRFLLVGQMAYGANGTVAKEQNGVVLFGSDGSNVAAAWQTLAAPVTIPEASDNSCPNYSSSLLPLDNGTVVLELASKWDGNLCKTYFARALLEAR